MSHTPFSFFNFFFFFSESTRKSLSFLRLFAFSKITWVRLQTHIFWSSANVKPKRRPRDVCWPFSFFLVHNFFSSMYKSNPPPPPVCPTLWAAVIWRQRVSPSLSCVCLFSVSGPGRERERDSFFRKRLDLSHWPAAVWCGPVISPVQQQQQLVS